MFLFVFLVHFTAMEGDRVVVVGISSWLGLFLCDKSLWSFNFHFFRSIYVLVFQFSFFFFVFFQVLVLIPGLFKRVK